MKQAHDGALVMGIIVTVPEDGNSSYDAFSRFFAPLYGVNEDPVTGKKDYVYSLITVAIEQTIRLIPTSFLFLIAE